MAVNERPTCVTVIGWAWIIIGGLMCFSAVMAFFMSMSMRQMMQEAPHFDRGVPAVFRFFPLIALAQLAVGALGLTGGISFLKLTEWARKLLLTLTALLLLFIAGFGIFWVIMWVSMTSDNAPPGFASMGLIMGIFNTALFGVPLGIMLKYLVGDRVKSAMAAPVGPSDESAAMAPSEGDAGGDE
jgi:hypothetical protein